MDALRLGLGLVAPPLGGPAAWLVISRITGEPEAWDGSFSSWWLVMLALAGTIGFASVRRPRTWIAWWAGAALAASQLVTALLTAPKIGPLVGLGVLIFIVHGAFWGAIARLGAEFAERLEARRSQRVS